MNIGIPRSLLGFIFLLHLSEFCAEHKVLFNVRGKVQGPELRGHLWVGPHLLSYPAFPF
jgi:hypothetical protein